MKHLRHVERSGSWSEQNEGRMLSWGGRRLVRERAHRRSERRVLRSSAKWRDDTVSFSLANAEVVVRARRVRIMRRKGLKVI